MNFKEQLHTIHSLQIPNNTDTRMDCPFCYHNNSFIISNATGKISWHCFYASCTAKGSIQKEKTIEDIQEYFKPKDKSKTFTVPKHFTLPIGRAERYLHNNNCMNAYTSGKAKIRYDVRQDRIVFLIQNNTKVVGAVGRAMNKNTYPKWFMYGDKKNPFICGNSDTAVIVEDCASACAVSDTHTGFALMGTSFSDEYIPFIKKYSKVIVALDRDATSKSFDIANKICYYINTQVKMLNDDLKYYKPSEIKEILQ